MGEKPDTLADRNMSWMSARAAPMTVPATDPDANTAKRADAEAAIAAIIGEWQFRVLVLRAGVEKIKRSRLTNKQAERIKSAAEELGVVLPIDEDTGVLQPPAARNPASREAMRKRYGQRILQTNNHIRMFAKLMLMDAEITPRTGHFDASAVGPGRPAKNAFRQLRTRLEARWESTFGVRSWHWQFSDPVAKASVDKLAAGAANEVWEILRRYCGSPVSNPRDGASDALDAIAPPFDVEVFLSPQELDALRDNGG